MEKNIAILSGDGIGPEIMREGLKVLGAIEKKYSHVFNSIETPFGAQAFYSHGNVFPDETKRVVQEMDATLKGPVGLSIDQMRELQKKGVQLELETILALRGLEDTYANFRPVFLPISLADFSPLKRERLGEGIDIMMIRELCGGNYFGKKVEHTETDGKYALDEGVYSSEQIVRITNVAFNEARKRGSKLTNVSKPNVMAEGRLWNLRVSEVAKKYPDVHLDNSIVDAMAYKLVVDPSSFNGVVLLENMQGDIITDQAGGILGSLGLMPSACLNPESGRGYYEPAHGSAPDIAGKNIANPYSMIGSVAFMLEKSFGLSEESRNIWDALTDVFAKGFRTGELAGSNTDKSKILKTTEFGDKVIEYIFD